MRLAGPLAICLLALTAQAGEAQKAAKPDSAALRQEIAALNRAMEDAVNRGDLKAAAAFYGDAAVVRTARRIVAQGRKQIDDYFIGIGKASWKLDVIQVGGHPDAPYQVGKSTLIHGERPDTSIVSFVVYWRRQADGKLKIELDYYH